MARQLLLVFLLASALLMTNAMAASAGGLKAVHGEQPNPADPDAVKAHYKSIAAAISDKIKHIVIVMMENRSFDHLFGFFGKGTNGLTGKEYNLVKTSEPHGERIYVDDKAPFINQCDPSHSYPGTMKKLYGNETHAKTCDYKCVNMGGFIEEEHKHKDDNYCNVMQSVDNAEKLPVMSFLAEEFAIMDRFFCSIPGPTWPNRLFHLSATSLGLTETSHWYKNVDKQLFPQKTIFDQVKEAGGEWKLYYNDTPWETFLESIAHSPENLHKMTQFYEDAREGNLPDYAFINPLQGSDANLGGCNDHHPDHDLRPGEAYYKDIYEALRASPQWNETLFIITYDEHGGFHDHVHPPTKVPIPEEGIESYPDAGFKFDRLGVRIPTLLISPWVPKGLVIGRAPDAQRPQPDSEYDLTSIMASSRKLLKKLKNTPPLTKRDAWASTFEHVVDMMDAPRTDCPKHTPMPGKPSAESVAAEGRLPLNDLQAEILSVNHFLAEPEDTRAYPSHVVQQSQAGVYGQAAFEKHRARTLQWKAGKGLLSSEVMRREKVARPTVAPLRMAAPADATDSIVASAWTISTNPQVPHATIHSADGLCFDVTYAVASAPVKANHCYPSTNPAKNRDRLQWWTVGSDATIRPATAPNLCVAHAGSAMVLAECDGSASQAFAHDAQTGRLSFAAGGKTSVVVAAH